MFKSDFSCLDITAVLFLKPRAVKERVMSGKSEGKTVGFTLRLDAMLFKSYEDAARKANLALMQNGMRGHVTAQDLMRRKLAERLPVIQLTKGEAE